MMSFFGAAHRWGGGWVGLKRSPIYKICHTYPKMMKLGTIIPYPKKIQKIYESCGICLEFSSHQHFFTRHQQILLYHEMQIEIVFWFIFPIYFNFSSVFIDCSKNMVKILIMSARVATANFPKIKIFWNKGYYIIYPVYDVTNKILSHDTNYIMVVVMWPKFGNSDICIRSYHNLNFIKIWTEKPLFFRGGLDSNSIIWERH